MMPSPCGKMLSWISYSSHSSSQHTKLREQIQVREGVCEGVLFKGNRQQNRSNQPTEWDSSLSSCSQDIPQSWKQQDPNWERMYSTVRVVVQPRVQLGPPVPHLLSPSQVYLLKLNFSSLPAASPPPPSTSCLLPPPLPSLSFAPLSTENTQSTYRVSPDGSLRATFASGMEINLSSEPHILAGAVNPTLGKCNISLPGEHNANLIEWRQRKEQNKGNVSAFERRLRVRPSLFSQGQKFMGSLRKWRASWNWSLTSPKLFWVTG